MLAVILGVLSISLFQIAYWLLLMLLFHVSQPDFGYSQSAQDVLVFFGWAVLLGPLGEEVFFRGFFGILFKKSWQFMLVSSILWAGFHVDLPSFLPLLFTGLVLAWIRIKTHSFYPCIVIHVTINLLALLLHFLA